MKILFIKIRNRLLRVLYKGLLRPILFHIDPEVVHNLFLWIGRALGSNPFTRTLTRLPFDFSHPSLERTIAGIHFKNPVGLSAGFDKNAKKIAASTKNASPFLWAPTWPKPTTRKPAKPIWAFKITPKASKP